MPEPQFKWCGYTSISGRTLHRYDQFDLWATKDQLQLIEQGLQLLMDIEAGKNVDIEGIQHELQTHHGYMDLYITHNLCSEARGDREVGNVRELRRLRSEGKLP